MVLARDSFVLARGRVGKKKKKGEKEREGMGALGTVWDASPGGSVEVLPLSGGAGKGKGDKGRRAGGALVDEAREEVGDHRHCPIYEVERPGWWVRKYGSGKG